MRGVLRELHKAGFDNSYFNRSTSVYRVQCSQCEALAINGVACHETGCPNIVKEEDDFIEEEED